MQLILLLPFVFISLYYVFIIKDILTPEVVVSIPIYTSIFLYSLMLSDFYFYENLSFLFYIFCISSLSLGFSTIFRSRSRSSSIDYISLIRAKISIKRLKHVVIFLWVMAIIVFIIESMIVTPPLLSETPNHNYMKFGLPVLHHFISLLIMNLFFSYIYFLLSNKTTILIINLITCMIIFTLLTQRLSIFICLIVLFSSYIFFKNKFFSLKLIFSLTFPILFFIGFFVFVGQERLGNVDELFILELTKINTNIVPTALALPYMYITAGVQNTLNTITQFNGYYGGVATILNFLPLFDMNSILEFEKLPYQFLINFTTFSFPNNLILDFSFLAPIACFAFGFLFKLVYVKAINGSLFYITIYISYFLPQGIFLFFSDNFITSSLFIYLFFAIFINSYILIKVKNECTKQYESSI